MIPLILAALGRAEKLEAMRRGFTSKSEPGSGVWSGMLLLAAIAVLAIGALLVLNRIQQENKARGSTGARTLFREVLLKLTLGFMDRALLRRITQEMKLENPTVMLLTPQLFAEVAYNYTATKPGKSASDLRRLSAICKQLFGQEMPQPEPVKPAEAEQPSTP